MHGVRQSPSSLGFLYIDKIPLSVFDLAKICFFACRMHILFPLQEDLCVMEITKNPSKSGYCLDQLIDHPILVTNSKRNS